ncbi:hypothetical protein F2Q70_00010149 [Brassica cretica]|uniref:Uncharacterized protein n=1 Tax=Brassica cretica TaxID=69181 RepID=A0A8S9M048_BRACR|nr:hypothetical protein F2Q70_00010149 [Brassica cretica]
MESEYSSAGVGNLEPSIATWHFQIAVYFAFGFFFLRLFLDRFVFQVSNYEQSLLLLCGIDYGS